MTRVCIFDGGEVCPWCRGTVDEHTLFWCPRCSGDGFVPDPTDRVSRRMNRPMWAWLQDPCECTRDEHGRVRRGGIVDRSGKPVEDADLREMGLTVLNLARSDG